MNIDQSTLFEAIKEMQTFVPIVTQVEISNNPNCQIRKNIFSLEEKMDERPNGISGVKIIESALIEADTAVMRRSDGSQEILVWCEDDIYAIQVPREKIAEN